MKLVSLIIYKHDKENSIELLACTELSAFNFFQRGPIKEHIRFHSRLCVSRTNVGQKNVVEFDQNLGKCNAWVNGQGLGVAVLVDAEYPMRVALTLLSEASRIFMERMVGKWENATADCALQCPEIEGLFQKFQNPTEADKLTKISKDLEEVKDTVMQSMNDLLQRGESLDQLMAKSKDLSNTSVQFYRTAKKNNQCCKSW